MVTIISGGANSSREELFVERIKVSAEKGEKVLVIVPDQFSFEYEKKLYGAMGAGLFNTVTTAGFNRLSELIINKYGGYAGENANDNAKIILMYKAVRRLRQTGDVKFYGRNLEKASFISEAGKLVSQLRESGITPEALQLAAETVGGAVSLKLFDISRLYKFYMEELEKAGMKDSLSAAAAAVRLAGKNGHFAGMSVYVSSFNDFTYDQRKMLELCVTQGESLTVSLLIDGECTAAFHGHPFAQTVRTEQQILDIAKAHNKQVQQISACGNSFNSRDILYLSKKLFDLNRKPYTASEDVMLYSATDLYEETEYICAQISELVRDKEKGCRYNDIVVVVRDLSSCAAVFEDIFQRYDIPYFIDMQDGVTASAIVHYLNAVFRTVLTKTYRTENIMKYIKSPLFGILNYDISDLEDYCCKWNVDGDMWKQPFTACEKGGERILEKVNRLREQIISPLEKFKEACKDASAKEICEALYVLLGEIRISQQTYSVVKRASESGNETQLELARGLKQLWTSALGGIKSIYDCLGQEKISLRRFYDLFSLMLSMMKISNPPQKLDCVRIADAAHSRIDGVKIVFAAELNDEIFPAEVRQGGLITEREKALLEKNGNVFIEANALRDFRSEKLAAYSALCAPTDRLYALYSTSDLLGNEKRPSSLVKEIREILGVPVRQVHKLPPDFFCTSYKTAYSKYLEHSMDKSRETMSIYQSLTDSDKYFGKLMHIKSVGQAAELRLSREKAEEMFFSGEMTKVSASKLDKYFSCPFAFFCSSGLSLYKPAKVELDPLNKGNIVHDLLEHIIKAPDSKDASGFFNEDFLSMDDKQLREYIHGELTAYYKSVLGGDFGKTPSFEFMFAKLEETAFNVVKFVQYELGQSDFRPVLAEYKFDSVDGKDALIFDMGEGKKIVLIGKIDRADIYETEDGQRFIRIIDYKTGKIDFSLARLYNGLNLQMLVYLSALLGTENALNPDKTLKQAGIMYLSLGQLPDFFDEEDMSDEKVTEKAKKLTMNAFGSKGRIVDDEQVLGALSKDKDFKGLPFRKADTAREKGILLSDEKFSAMRKFAELKVKEFGRRILDGEIAARPLEGVCSNCDYQNICGQAFPDSPVDPDAKEYEEKLDAKLNEMVKEAAENER